MATIILIEILVMFNLINYFIYNGCQEKKIQYIDRTLAWKQSGLLKILALKYHLIPKLTMPIISTICSIKICVMFDLVYYLFMVPSNYCTDSQSWLPTLGTEPTLDSSFPGCHVKITLYSFNVFLGLGAQLSLSNAATTS